MAYRETLSKPFLNDIKDIKKDKVLLERLHKKMDEILGNPEHYSVKRYELKGKRAAHIGSFVIIFEIKGDEVIFLKFKHHDFAYD